jgi:hypothetical protein
MGLVRVCDTLEAACEQAGCSFSAAIDRLHAGDDALARTIAKAIARYKRKEARRAQYEDDFEEFAAPIREKLQSFHPDITGANFPGQEFAPTGCRVTAKELPRRDDGYDIPTTKKVVDKWVREGQILGGATFAECLRYAAEMRKDQPINACIACVGVVSRDGRALFLFLLPGHRTAELRQCNARWRTELSEYYVLVREVLAQS